MRQRFVEALGVFVLYFHQLFAIPRGSASNWCRAHLANSVSSRKALMRRPSNCRKDSEVAYPCSLIHMDADRVLQKSTACDTLFNPRTLCGPPPLTIDPQAPTPASSPKHTRTGVMADNETPSLRANVATKGRLVDRPLWQALLILTTPVMAEQLLTMLVGLVDVYLTGQYLSSEHLAAIGIMSYLLWTIPSLFGAVAIGTLAIVSRSVGAGDVPTARKITNQAMSLGFVLSLTVTIICWIWSPEIVKALRLEGDALAFAQEYFAWIVPVIPCIMFQQVGMAALRGAGDTLSGAIVLTCMNILNVVISYCLVTGALGFWHLGWSGVAIGTAVSYVIGGAVTLVMLACGRRELWLRPRLMVPKLDSQIRLIRVGLPGGADMTVMVGCQLWFLGIVNSLGTIPAAAHALAIRVESLAYLPCNAFQVAASSLVGQYLGAGRPDAAKRVTLVILGISATLMLAFGAGFIWAGESLVAWFLSGANQETGRISAKLLVIIAWGLPSLAAINTFYGALRGAGETRGPLMITLFCFLAIRLPLAIFLSLEAWPISIGQFLPSTFPNPLGLGIVGAWYAMVTDLIIRCLLASYRFAFGPWQSVRV